MVQVVVLDAVFENGNWKFANTQKNMKNYDSCGFCESKKGYSYAYNPFEENDYVAMIIFKAFICEAQKKKIVALYKSIEGLH